jgi:hypothetical protein
MIIGSEAPITHPSINPSGAQEREGIVGSIIAPKIIRIREKITMRNNDSPDISPSFGIRDALDDVEFGEEELDATEDDELEEDEYELGATDDLSVLKV